MLGQKTIRLASTAYRSPALGTGVTEKADLGTHLSTLGQDDQCRVLDLRWPFMPMQPDAGVWLFRGLKVGVRPDEFADVPGGQPGSSGQHSQPCQAIDLDRWLIEFLGHNDGGTAVAVPPHVQHALYVSSD